MSANLSPHTCLSCGVAPGRNHIDGCPASPMQSLSAQFYDPAAINGGPQRGLTRGSEMDDVTRLAADQMRRSGALRGGGLLSDLMAASLLYGGGGGGSMSPTLADTLRRVRDLAPSTRCRFWAELRALVEAEWGCPPGYDRTAWAMEHATAGMVEAAYQRVAA